MKVNIGKFHKRSNRRTIDVKIDGYDTYSLDHTLSLIILPALIQLKETMHGIPTDFSEVGGEEYHDQMCFDFYKEDQNEMFEKRCQTWKETLDKMIWSFQQIALEDYEDQYHHGKADYDWVESDKTYPNPLTGKIEKTYQMVDKNPDEHWYDFVGQQEHEKRIQEGLNLFGKYFRNLWD